MLTRRREGRLTRHADRLGRQIRGLSWSRFAVLLLAVVSVLSPPAAEPAEAAVPGANGKIAFQRDPAHIWVMDPDGTDETQLTTELEMPDSFPAWSPDGKMLAFRRRNDIYTMNDNGTGQTNLTNDPAFDAWPVWSPDGSQIAFGSDRADPGGSTGIYLMNSNGSSVTPFVKAGGMGAAYPAWSPDGSRIAFTVFDDDLYVANTDGTGLRALTHNAAGEFLPDWSPDGSRIVFQRSTAVGHDIFVINADGTNERRLTRDSVFDGHPAWSPDGTKIAFIRSAPSFDVHVMNSDGSGRTNLTNTPSVDEYEPDWQPLPVFVADNAFQPDIVRAGVGGQIRWERAEGAVNSHNIREDGQIFRSGDPTTDPIDFQRIFSAGTFHYYCEFHGAAVMDGQVKIPVAIRAGPGGLPFTVRWASPATETGSLFDVMFRVGSGSWRTWKTNTSLGEAVFGANGRPVRLVDGRRYSFRARSQEGDAQSLWSPVRSFVP
jgi:Tol biopolymer transport system component